MGHEWEMHPKPRHVAPTNPIDPVEVVAQQQRVLLRVAARKDMVQIRDLVVVRRAIERVARPLYEQLCGHKVNGETRYASTQSRPPSRPHVD